MSTTPAANDATPVALTVAAGLAQTIIDTRWTEIAEMEKLLTQA